MRWIPAPAIASAAAVMVLLACPAPRAAGLNDTGQTRCHDGIGTPIDCSSPLGRLQDASYGRDPAVATGQVPRLGSGAGGFDFTKISETGAELAASAPLAADAWVCTRDNLTGLTWWIGRFLSNWNGAAAEVATLNAGDGTCARSDWRRARIVELQGIVRYDLVQNPHVDTAYFPLAFVHPNAPITWSGDDYVYPDFGFDLGLALAFNGGSMGTYGKTQIFSVVAVSGPMPGAVALQDQGDGTRLDPRTGLVFTRCALGTTPAGSSCTGTVARYAWEAALQAVAAANAQTHLGHADWRLPNVKELTSLAVYGLQQPAQVQRRWSSTSYPSFANSAMSVDIVYGTAYDSPKSDTHSVLMVRAGGDAAFQPDPAILFGNGFE